MKTLYHRGGPWPCYKAAILVKQLPSRYEIAADNVMKLDGTAPSRGEGMFCGSCGNPVVPQWLFASPDAQPVTV